MKIEVIKEFKACVGEDIHPTTFACGVYNTEEDYITERVATLAVQERWAKKVGESGKGDGKAKPSSVSQQAPASQKKTANTSKAKQK